jgi:hypothetical protein
VLGIHARWLCSLWLWDVDGYAEFPCGECDEFGFFGFGQCFHFLREVLHTLLWAETEVCFENGEREHDGGVLPFTVNGGCLVDERFIRDDCNAAHDEDHEWNREPRVWWLVAVHHNHALRCGSGSG